MAELLQLTVGSMRRSEKVSTHYTILPSINDPICIDGLAADNKVGEYGGSDPCTSFTYL